MNVEIKPFTANDIDFAVAQAEREGWATGRPYFELHVEDDPAGAFIAWAGNRRIGMITATRYAATGWLGNLIVEPDYRSKGAGRKLMERGFGYLRDAGIGTIRLDADPPGIPLYRSMGFEEEYESLRFRWDCSYLPPAASVDLAEKFSPQDLPEAAALDKRCFGDDRSGLLSIMHRQVTDAYITRDRGRLSGYLFVMQSSTGIRLGPCCTESIASAQKLLTAALAGCVGTPVALGIPSPNRTGQDLLVSLGFQVTPSCLRMIWGDREGVGELDGYFAIAGGAVG